MKAAALFAALFCATGLAVAVGKEPAQPRKNGAARKAEPPSVRGLAFHLCSCGVPCSCLATDVEVEGCNVIYVFHVTDGGYLGKSLVGNTAIVIGLPENLRGKPGAPRTTDGAPADGIIFVPDTVSSQAQVDLVGGVVLEMRIMSGMSNNVVRRVPIDFRKVRDRYVIDIPKLFHAEVAPELDAKGKQRIIVNTSTPEGDRWQVGRTKAHTFRFPDLPDWTWDLRDRNGSWTPFKVGPHKDPGDH